MKMDANRILNLTRRIVEEKTGEHANCLADVSSLSSAINLAHENMSTAFKLFAHTQFVQNVTGFGSEVNSLADESAKQKAFNRQAITDLRITITGIDGNLATRTADLEKARGVVTAELKTDEAFGELQNALDKHTRAFEQGKEKFGSLINEAGSKIPAYDRNRAFRYLLHAAFGTSSYARSGIFARLDGMIARKARYADNKRAYDILCGLRDESERALSELESSYTHALEAYEKYEADAYQIPSIAHINSEIETVVASLNEHKAKLSECLERDSKHIEYTDSLSLEAKALIYKVLEQQDAQALSKLAGSTTSEEDDKALSLIQISIRKIQELTSDLDTAKRNLQDSEFALDRAKAMHRTVDNDSRLSGDNYEYSSESRVSDLLSNFVRGAITANSLVDELKRYSEYVPPPPPPSYSSPSRSSIGSGGGSFTTRNSSGGGSFRTTNKF